MVTAMSSLETMVDVNTIIGDIVTTPEGSVIIPVSRVSFGFAAGGSEFNTNKINKYSESPKLPFGGGSGAGVNITPEAFLVVKDGNTTLLNLNNNTPIDKLIDLIPDAISKITSFTSKIIDKKPKKTDEL
jgi:sporulation protein YtfJ